MSDQRFNRGGIDQGLAEYLGLKGQLRATVESIIVPTLVTRDLSDTPYSRDSRPIGGFLGQLAVAGQFGYVWIVPAAGTALQLTQLYLINLDGAAQALIHMRRLNDTDTGVIGPGAQVPAFALVARPTWEPTAAVLESGTDASAVIGQTVGFAQLQPNTTLVVTLPPPGILLTPDGAVAGTRPRFGIANASPNAALGFAFHGREWPLPG